MTAPAAFRAVYSDWKLIKTRKCVQIVFEVPTENADEAYKVLSGMPNFGESAWYAIAKLNPAVSANGKPAPFDGENLGSNPSAAAKKPWAELTYPQQTGILCAEPSFGVFLQERHTDNYNEAIGMPSGPERAAECVRLVCGVTSRSEITPDSQAGKIWKTMASDYRSWMRADGEQ